MTDYTNRIRRAATWIDHHPDLPEPVLRATPAIQLAWHIEREPLDKQGEVIDAVLAACGNVPWDVKRQGEVTWVVAEADGIEFVIFVKARSNEGFTMLELDRRVNA